MCWQKKRQELSPREIVREEDGGEREGEKSRGAWELP